MPKLKYIGDGRWVPLWPARDHVEKDEEVATAKVESGLYEVVEKPPRKKKRAKEASNG